MRREEIELDFRMDEIPREEIVLDFRKDEMSREEREISV